MTFEITMNDSDFKTVNEYATENKINLSKFFLESALERIEDAKWKEISYKIIERNKKVYAALAK